MKRTLLLILPPMALALAGCGSTTASSATSSLPCSEAASSSSECGSSAAASSGGTIHVSMKNLAFDPSSVNAKVGQTVEWTNNDSPAHNVVPAGGLSFKGSSTLSTGQTFKLKLTKPGTIHYICSIHPFMKATIVVSR